MNHEEHAQADTKKMMGGHGVWHWACCILPIVTTAFWVVAVVFLIAAWVSIRKQELVWGYSPDWWITNALVLGVLAIFGRGKHCRCYGKCAACGSPNGVCVCGK